MSIKQEKGVAYIAPLSIKPKRSHQLHRERNNHSLPSINGVFKEQKVNGIRNQIDETKNQIIVLKARINALKWEKNKHDKKQKKHSNEIDFIHTVRDRLYEDRKYKLDVQQRKERELQYLKQQATSMREKMLKDRDLAKSMVSEQKQMGAQEERQKRKEDEDNIRRMKNLEIIENQLKAKNIKKSELEIQEKMKMFYSSRVTFAKANHHERVQRSLTEKQKLEVTLKELKKEEEMMMEECKRSQANMMTTLYELETLNPERKRKNSITNSVSSKNTILKHN